MATHTLQRMRAGGVYDRHMGGFFRYSTTRDWSVPHYEKMLHDNVKLAVVYLNAFKLTGDDCYRQAAVETAGYIHSTLASPAGGFYGSQDTDEEYYSLPLPERLKRPAPKVDSTVYVDGSALAARAYLDLSALPELHMLREHAFSTISFLTEKCRAPGGGMFHYFVNGQPCLGGLLADQVHAARLFTAAYRATQESAYLGAATGLAAYMAERLWDRGSGRFFDRAPDTEAEGRLAHPEADIDENASVATLLVELHYLTGLQGYMEMAETTLAAFAGIFARYGILAASYALAVDLFLNPIFVSVIGEREDQFTRALRRVLQEAYLPSVIVEQKSPAPAAPHERPRARVCAGKTCLPPISDPTALKERLLELGRIAGR